jgi:2-dehydro-3-deoxygluconokinase
MTQQQAKRGALDIVALGEPMIEFNQQDPAKPLEYRRGFGGDTSNFAVSAARAGRSRRLYHACRPRCFGEALLSLWRDEGVDASGVAIDDSASTGIYFVSHSSTGHAFTYLRSGSAASRMRPVDVPVELIEQSKYLHVSESARRSARAHATPCFMRSSVHAPRASRSPTIPTCG